VPEDGGVRPAALSHSQKNLTHYAQLQSGDLAQVDRDLFPRKADALRGTTISASSTYGVSDAKVPDTLTMASPPDRNSLLVEIRGTILVTLS
jgi:hypothetical protein